ncbi:MAG: endonuclease [Candidatus Cloacimonas sp.]|jgi:hypothetical protein|nr:endonuclease [Candidatus Cloacimonas sp.]
MFKTILKYSLCLLILSFTLGLYADYYDSVISLTGQPLYNGLRSLISNNTNTSYDTSKDVLFQTLDNFGGTVTCVYTGQVYSISSSYNGSSDPNTEHTYAQSWFTGSETSKMKSDLHHLFVTNSVVNSSRGNYPLTTVANHSSATVYYTSTPRQSYRGNSATGHMVFEPADQFKGNIARALLYFNTRYSGNSLVQQGEDMLPVLLQWHIADPPDAAEITRNTGVYNYQHNRNPYIDHPEFVARIWGGSAADDGFILDMPALQISAMYPNPFAGELSIKVLSKSAAPISTTIYNIRGQKLFSQVISMQAEENKFTWNGMDADNHTAPAGIYIIKAVSGSDVAVGKVVKR